MITIEPCDDYDGCVSTEYLIGDEVYDIDAVADFIVGMYAGRAAELKIGEDSGGCWDDDEKAQELLDRFPSLNESELRERARIALEEQWSDVELLARYVLHHGKLDGQRADMLLCDEQHALRWFPDLSIE